MGGRGWPVGDMRVSFSRRKDKRKVQTYVVIWEVHLGIMRVCGLGGFGGGLEVSLATVQSDAMGFGRIYSTYNGKPWSVLATDPGPAMVCSCTVYGTYCPAASKQVKTRHRLPECTVGG